MADIQANIGIGVDTTQALASIRALQRQISAFHTSMAKGGAAAGAQSAKMQQNLVNTINSSGKFSASMVGIQSSTESFTNALEKNKLSMGQYFRYAGGASRSFGKMFSREFNTISNVAQERVKDLQTQYVSMGRNANGALQSIKVRPLSLDMDNLGTKVQLAGQKQQIFNQLMKQGTTNLLNFGKNTQWAGRQLMVGFTIPLTIFGGIAAKEFMKLEEQAVKFKRVYGDMFTTDADTDKALSNIKELANEFTKYGIAVEKTIGLAAKVAQMGNVGTALTEQVTQATRLAVLGGIEQEEALDTTISLTNAFGIAAEDLAGKIAFLNAAENQTILSIEDFNIAIPLAGSVVQQLGGNVEDLAFFLTAMREGGINASQGANALKTSLARLVAPTEVAKKEMAAFGIDIVGIVDKNAGNLKNTVVTLGSELDKLDPLNRARAIEQLFGKFQFARMSTMFQNISKEGGQARKILELTGNSTEELAIIADRELARVEDSVAFKFKKNLETLQAALAPIGGEFLKAVLPLVEFGTKLLKMFNNLGDGGKQFIVVATAIAGVVLPAALMGFGLVANGVANLVKMFAFLGGAFGRISGQSRILGTGTEYLTQEQVQAAAVAASLGQSHTNLIQVFSAETASINGLISAYTRAIAAQNAFSGSARIAGAAAGAARASANIPTTTRYNPFLGPQAPKKYAKGVLSVPGPKGAGDVVPAMLSPGEAVVPSAQAQKYAPFINSIIADNVPGFFGGRFALPRDRQFGHMDSGFGVPAEFLTQFPEGSKARRSGDMFTAAGAGQRNVNAKSSWGRGQDPELNRLSATGDAPFKAQRADFAAGGAADFFPAVSEAGFDPSNSSIAKDVQEYQDLFMQLFDDADTAGAKFVADTDSNLAAKKERVRAKLGEDFDNDRFDRENMSLQTIDSKTSELRAGTPTAQARQSGSSTVKEFRATTLTKEEEAAILASGDPSAVDSMSSYYKRSDRTTNRGAQMEVPKRDKKIAQTAKSFASPQDDSLKASGLANAEAYNDGLEAAVKDAKDVASEMAGRNSPHPEAFPDGADDARDYVRGQESVLSSGSDPYASSSSAPPPPPMMPTPPIAKSGKFFGNIKDRAKSAGNKAMDLGLQTGPGKKMANYFAETSGANITNSKGQIVSTLHQEVEELGRASKKAAGQVDDNTQSIQENGNAAGAAGDIKDNIARDQQGNPILGSNGSPVTNKEIKRTANQQKRQARAGKALGALGTATMVAGMATQVDGKVGEIAQQVVGPMAALSGIAPLLMALPAPIAALVAVIGLGVAGFLLYNKAMNKAYDETYELTRAMGTSTKAMESFANFAGTVTSGEVLSKQREQRLSQYSVATGKTTFGSAFVGSEEGTEFVNQVRESIQTLGRDKTVSMVFQQMGAAVSQGILTQDQARSIVGNLGLQLDNLAFSANVDAKLISLLGPNGENLLEGPLLIPAIIAAEQMDMLAQDVDSYNADRSVLAMEEVGAGETASRVVNDILKYLPGYLVLQQQTGFDMGADDEFTDSIDAERQRRIDSGEVSGWWSRTMLALTTDTFIAGEMLQKGLGSVAANVQNSLEGQQSAIDTIRLNSEKKIAEAIENGADYSKIAELREEEAGAIEDAISQIRESTDASIAFIRDLPKKDQEEIQGQQRARILDNAGEGVDKGVVGKALDEVYEGVEFSVGYVFSAAYEGGQFSLTDFTYLSTLDGATKDVYYNISTNLSAGEAGQIIQIAEQIKDEDVRSNFEMSFEGLEGSELTDAIYAAEQIARLSTFFNGDLTLPVGFIVNNPEQMTSFMNDMDEFTLRAKEGGFDANVEIFTEIFGAEAVEAAQRGILANQAEFDALPDEMQIRYGAYFTLFMDMAVEDGALMDMAEAATGLQGEDAVAAWVMDILPALGPDTSTAPGEPESVPTGGGGGSEPQVDSLIKKLRDLRIATIDMKKGWKGMQEVLANVFAGGTQSINVFSGLSNQIRKLGVGSDLIELIVGMDPEEYDKRKNELFVFDAAGNIVATTDKLKNMGAAFNAIALGEFANDTQATIQGMRDQTTAMTKLISAGATYVDAYKMVQNQALATAIAQSASAVEVRELISLSEKLSDMTRRNEEESNRSSAATAVRQTNEEFANQVAILNKLASSSSRYTDAQKDAILGDKNLQTLMLNPSIDPNALRQAIIDAERKSDIELRVRLATTDGTRSVFDEGFSKAMDAFSRQEQDIDIKFNAKISADEKTIKEAEEQIASIQFNLDDYNADLERMSWKEEDINDKYEKRFEALDAIADTNDRITKQQQAQLSIADALSQGDIAGAARAAAELRSQQVDDAAQTQREMLEKAQEAEVNSLRSAGGLSKTELEDRIKMLERTIFNIEETATEPAQERIRLAQSIRDAEVEALTVLEKTRDEWDGIKNGIDMAEISGWKFTETMQNALDVVEKLMAAYPEEKPAPPPPPPAAPARSSGGGSAPAPAPSPVPSAPRTSTTPAKTQEQIDGLAAAKADIASRVAAQAAAAQRAANDASNRRRDEAMAGRAGMFSSPPPKPIHNTRGIPQRRATGGMIIPKRMAVGGFVGGYAPPPLQMNMGGKVKGYAAGGLSMGSDIVPAMLTPGEFVVRKRAVQNFGMENLEQINSGKYSDGSVYNYNLAVNVKSDADPSRIARTVMGEIKRVESQRIRGNRL